MEIITAKEFQGAKKASLELSMFYGTVIGVVLLLIKPMQFIGLWQYFTYTIIVVALILIIFVFDFCTMTHNRSIFEVWGKLTFPFFYW